jgi:hypothetical protein
MAMLCFSKRGDDLKRRGILGAGVVSEEGTGGGN